MTTSYEELPARPMVLQWAMMWLFSFTMLFCLNALLALFGLEMHAWHLPFCIALSVAMLYLIDRREQRALGLGHLLGAAVAFFLVAILLGKFVSLIWEYSYWGRGYYTDAILALCNGWNPVYDGIKGVSEAVYRSSKALWYVDASFYSFFGHYEMAKVHTFLLMVPTFMLTQRAFAVLLPRHRRLSALAAAVALLNPVAFAQVFTFYGDAVLAYLIQCFLVLAFLILNEGYLHNDMLAVLAGVWLFMLHMQGTGLRAALVLGVAFVVMVALLYKRQALRWLAIRAGAVVVCGFAVVGFNPFVQNLLDTGHLWYSATDADGFMPQALAGKSYLGQAIASLFASPNASFQDSNILLQQLTALVSSSYASADVAMRGFGFFGGWLIVVAIVVILLQLFLPKYRDEQIDAPLYEGDEYVEEDSLFDTPEEEGYVGRRVAILWLTVPLLAIAILTPTLWWARTVAALWFLIPVAFVCLCSRRADGRSALARLLMFVTLVNVLLIAVSVVPTVIGYSSDMQAYWQRMSAEELPTDEDAQRHNEYVKEFKAWNTLKTRGEKEREDHAVWTKVEGLF